MPGRGHRIASRQAQLGQRRRRQGRAAPTLPASPPPVSVEEEEAQSQPAPQTAPVAASPRPAPRARPEYRPGVLNYIGPELKRIAALGTLSVVVLVVLGVVL